MDMKITGLKKTLKALRTDVPNEVSKKVVPHASRQAFRIVVASAKSKVPVRTGWLKKSLVTKSKRYRNGTFSILLGPRVHYYNTETGEDPAKIAHLVELGTAPHAIGEGEHPGTEPQPFMRPAVDENRNAVITKFIQIVKQRIKPWTS